MACLVIARARRKKASEYVRWQRPVAMAFWQIDIVGGVWLVDTSTGELREAKVVTGLDDHSRFCVIARGVERAIGRAVCLALAGALRRFGAPEGRSLPRITLRLLGPSSSVSHSSRSAHASSAKLGGLAPSARELGERAFADSERIVGPDHPDTLSAGMLLVGTYAAAGRTDYGIEHGQRVSRGLRADPRPLGTSPRYAPP